MSPNFGKVPTFSTHDKPPILFVYDAKIILCWSRLWLFLKHFLNIDIICFCLDNRVFFCPTLHVAHICNDMSTHNAFWEYLCIFSNHQTLECVQKFNF